MTIRNLIQVVVVVVVGIEVKILSPWFVNLIECADILVHYWTFLQ